MPPLRRHQLAHLSAAGWQEVLAQSWDDELRACLRLWAQGNLPLVVTRQHLARDNDQAPVSLGLSAPAQFDRRRVALQVPPSRIAWFGEFPLLTEAMQQLPRTTRPALDAACRGLAALGVKARAYGSVGWQHMIGLKYLHERSDLDLWLAVGDVDQADAAANVLRRHVPSASRLDGELVFTDGSAVDWREWLAWRAGTCHALLVKRLNGASIERDREHFARAAGWAA
jgi:phosphoribosyl-dephospho-CoA transferase